MIDYGLVAYIETKLSEITFKSVISTPRKILIEFVFMSSSISALFARLLDGASYKNSNE